MLLGKDFDLGDYPELLSWVQCNHEATYEQEKIKSNSEKGDVMMEAQVRVMILKMDEETIRQRDAGSCQQLEKVRKQIIPESLQRECSSVDILIVDPCLHPEVQNHKRAHVLSQEVLVSI